MAQQQQDQRSRLEAALINLSNMQPDTLVRQEVLGEQNFEEMLPDFRGVLRLFSQLRKCSLEDLPDNRIKSLGDTAENWLTRFNDFAKFSIKQPDHTQRRASLIQSFRSEYATLWDTVTPLIAYFSTRMADFAALEEKARTQLQLIEKIGKEQLVIQGQAVTQTQEVLESVRRAAAEVGVSQDAIFFSEEAKSHDEEAKKSLKLTVWLAVATAGLALLSAFGYLLDWFQPTREQAVPFAISKVVLFSVLFFALAVANRNHKAHRHNYVVNRHRRNALATFQAFVKGTSDEATKNAVLLKSAETVFSPVASGYLTREPESQGTSQVLEIVRTALNKGGD